MHPSSFADLLVAAECLLFINADREIKAFSAVLKAAGMFAIWFYG